MAFTFLHAADLHLGSPFQGLATRDAERGAAVARRFAAASREAFQELVDRALAEEVAFVVIAGDVYDGAWKDTSIGLFFHSQLARLTRAGIPVYLVAGNHDAESVVSSSISLPERVHRFSSRRAETLTLPEHRVALHGLSFAKPVMDDNPVSGFPARRDGWFNIGVLHTSLEGAAEHIRYAPCSIKDLVGTGYDYWALGHVHDFALKHENPHVVYPGNLQGRSVRECGPKGAVFVDVADGRVAQLRRAFVDRARFAHAEIDITGLDSVEALDAALRAGIDAALAPTLDRLTALRVTLSGASGLHGRLVAEREHWREEIHNLTQQRHDDAWLEALKLRTTTPVASTDAEAAAVDADDLTRIVDALLEDPALTREVADLAASLGLPAGIPLSDDATAWLAAARATLLARVAGAGGSDAAP
jgi:DNA repair exonuclease SbcCD nuclease subunit